MGTRADFYTEEKGSLIWLGSIAFDGYAIETADEDDLSPNDKKNRTRLFLECMIKKCKNRQQFKKLIKEYLTDRNDAAFLKNGWPWPWNNSKTTDKTYLFKDGRLWTMWDFEQSREDSSTPCRFVPIEESLVDQSEEEIEPNTQINLCVPDMSALKNVAYGDRSGLLIVTTKQKS